MSISAAAIEQAIEDAMAELIAFVGTLAFRSVIAEMQSLPEALRHEFVELVLLDSDQLKRRGVTLPDGVEVQRSYFGDHRPTLFCINKFLPDGLGWRRVTVTFDNDQVGNKPGFIFESDGTLLPVLDNAYSCESVV